MHGLVMHVCDRAFQLDTTTLYWAPQKIAVFLSEEGYWPMQILSTTGFLMVRGHPVEKVVRFSEMPCC